MREGHRSAWTSILPAVAFWLGTVVYAWRLVNAGVTVVSVIPAICFPIAATLTTMRAVDWHRRGR